MNERKPQARFVQAEGMPEDNLANHPVVHHAPLSLTEPPLCLPVWISERPDSRKPPTYDGWFWDIEPMGEYLYFLAGAYARNEKGLLRFGTAPVELRVEKCFEADVIAVTEIDSFRDQKNAAMTPVELSGIKDLTLGEASDARIPTPDASSEGRWFMSLTGAELDPAKGWARLTVGRHWKTAEPFMQFLFEQPSPKSNGVPHASIATITATSRIPEMRIGDLFSAFAPLMKLYRDMPYVAVSGAIRM